MNGRKSGGRGETVERQEIGSGEEVEKRRQGRGIA